MTMGGEMTNFISACHVVIACLTYCYLVSSRFPKGKVRFLSLLPVISTFTFLPLIFSTVLLQFYSGLYIGWICNFKLLLFAFGRDDTLSINRSISLLNFIVIVAFPIKVKHNLNRNLENKENMTSYLQKSNTIPSFAVNVLMWCIIMHTSVNYKPRSGLANQFVIHVLYTFRMFCSIQVQFVFAAGLAKLLLREEIEPQFQFPLAATSLQNFWGRRWNRYVSHVLKTSIHEPTKSLLTPFLGRRWAVYPAILATFLVSGLMHELVHFYVGRLWPTWEVMWYFTIQGVCLAIEVEVKKRAATNGWKVSPKFSMPLTLVFMVVTSSWLGYTELIKWGVDQREVDEYIALLQYVKRHVQIIHGIY